MGTSWRTGRRAFGAGLALLLGLAAAVPLARADELRVGDPAPDFMLMGSDDKLHTLATYRGKKGVVLAWFPKAFTPG